MPEPTGLVYGVHAAESVLSRRPADVRRAWCIEHADGDRLRALGATLKSLGIPLQRVSRAELDKICRGGAHQGIVLDVRAPAALDVTGLEALVAHRGRAVRLLILDQVEDPRNLGACLRSADAAGVDCVIVPKAHSAGLTAPAIKASAGAADTVPVAVVPNLARVIRWLKDAGVWIVGADGSAATLAHEARLVPPIALALGAEARGLRRLTREHCDELVRIPMYGTVESLNVSVAAGILLFELARQSPPA